MESRKKIKPETNMCGISKTGNSGKEDERENKDRC